VRGDEPAEGDGAAHGRLWRHAEELDRESVGQRTDGEKVDDVVQDGGGVERAAARLSEDAAYRVQAGELQDDQQSKGGDREQDAVVEPG